MALSATGEAHGQAAATGTGNASSDGPWSVAVTLTGNATCTGYLCTAVTATGEATCSGPGCTGTNATGENETRELVRSKGGQLAFDTCRAAGGGTEHCWRLVEPIREFG